MDMLTARPRLLKQANLSMIRKAIKSRGTATRAEIAEETAISSTTIRTLLREMQQNGEIESAGHDASSGGRKAERYRFTQDRFYGAAFCLTDRQVHALLVNVCGEIVETVMLDAEDGDHQRAIVPFLDELAGRKELKSIGVGVPGVVDRGGFWRKSPTDGVLYRSDIGDALHRRYGLPVVVENDMNATAIGFQRCYEKEFPSEDPESTSMAYVHFEQTCVSAGFIADGRLVRGSCNFAGELGLVLMDGDRLVDESMAGPMDDIQYTSFVVRIVSWICGILNPQYVALGGPALRKDCIGPIGDGLSSFLPKHMAAEILYAPDVRHDYYDGMAYLTARSMFDDVQFIKEQPCAPLPREAITGDRHPSRDILS